MGALLIVFGVVLLVVGIASAVGKLPRNPVIGMRTRATMSSDAAWAAAHRASAWSPIVAGLGTLVAGVYLMIARPGHSSEDAITLAVMIFLLVIVIIGGVQADLVARRLES